MREAEKAAIREGARRELLRREARRDYYSYVQYVHGGMFRPTRAAALVAHTAEDFILRETGNPYDILILEMPPQHGKSMTVTETLPSWYLGRWPDKRVIEISYDQPFAQRFGRRNRQKVEEYGESLFGISLDPGVRRADEFEIRGHRGGMKSRGVKAGVTGNPCELMIIDDPIKSRMEADSAAFRRMLQEEWVSSFRSRLAAGAKVIVILTPWHPMDLAGYLLETEPNCTLLRLPCECDGEDDPLGRRIGEALCPELGKGDAWLQAFKRGFRSREGSRAWNALYQCRPSDEEGGIFKRSWWKYYRREALPPLPRAIISVDAAFKGREDNDFVCIQAWGKAGAGCYLLDMDKRHMDFPETLRAIRAMAARYPRARPIYIEDKANGPAVISMLRHEIPGILPVNPEGGKTARAAAVSGFVEAGNVFLPQGEDITAELVESCAAFPNGAHDDDVDALSQGLNKLFYQSGEEEAVWDPEDGPTMEQQYENMFG